jgi:hypothetical protein
MAVSCLEVIAALGERLHVRSRQHPRAGHLTEMTRLEQLRNPWCRHPQQFSRLPLSDELWHQEPKPPQWFKGIEGFS